MRFASHRDVARAIERGVRKAGLPVAYSAGFSPHPRISYSGGAPTGSASEAEYLEISLTSRWEPAHLGRLLDEALPDGIDVVEVVEVDAKSAELRLDASLWEVLLPGVPADVARSARDAFLASPSVVVERLTTKGKRQLDAREAVLSLDVDRDVDAPASAPAHRHVGPDPRAGCAILRMVVRQTTPAVRPDDILTALGQFTTLAPKLPPVVTRLWQGPLDSATGQADVACAVAAHAVEVHTVMAVQTGTNGATGTAESDPLACASQAHPSQIPVPPTSANAPGLARNQAMRLEAGCADQAPAARPRANEQLPRGERADRDDLRAREPNGRDCTNARNRATEQAAGPE